MASTTTGTAPAGKSATSSRDISPFLKLPRELRDIVYDEGLDDHEIILPCHNKVRATNVARIEFLTLNHQIKIEYEERVAKKAVLELHDAPNFKFAPFNLPPGATRIPRVKLHLAAGLAVNLVPLENENEISHSSWIKPFLQQHTKLEALSIVINFDSRNTRTTPTDVMVALNASFWPNIPQLKALYVRDATPRANGRARYDTSAAFDFSYEDPVVLEWSPMTRKVELVM